MNEIYLPPTLSEVLAREIAPVRWIIPNLLPVGLSIIIGGPKIGKTYLAMNMATAITAGGSVLGQRVLEPADCLYLDFEMGERRIQQRAAEMFPSYEPDFSKLRINPMGEGDIPRVSDKLFAFFDNWRRQTNNASCIFVDVYQAIAPLNKKSNQNAYEADTEALTPLRTYANNHNIAIVLLHHPSKNGGAGDPMAAASGSIAMTSVPNNVFNIRKDGKGTEFLMRGHDVDDRCLAVELRNGWWHCLGDAATVSANASVNKIVEAIVANGGPMTRAEIHDETDLTEANIKKTIQRELKKERSRLVKVGNKVDIPGRENVSPVSPSENEEDNPLQNKDNSMEETGTVEVSPKHENMSPVPAATVVEPGKVFQTEPLSDSETSPSDFRQHDNTLSQTETGDNSPIEGTVTNIEGVPEEAIENKVNSSVRGQEDTDFPPNAFRLLESLINSQRPVEYRRVFKTLGKFMNADAIKESANWLLDRQYITVEKIDEEKDTLNNNIYDVAPTGNSAYHQAIQDPNQTDLMDLLST